MAIDLRTLGADTLKDMLLHAHNELFRNIDAEDYGCDIPKDTAHWRQRVADIREELSRR